MEYFAHGLVLLFIFFTLVQYDLHSIFSFPTHVTFDNVIVVFRWMIV